MNRTEHTGSCTFFLVLFKEFQSWQAEQREESLTIYFSDECIIVGRYLFAYHEYKLLYTRDSYQLVSIGHR
jgi:hypothetical protein